MIIDVKSGTATILQIEEAKAARSYEEAKNVTKEKNLRAERWVLIIWLIYI